MKNAIYTFFMTLLLAFSSTVNASPNNSTLNQVFHSTSTQSAQVKLLSEREMKGTEGEIWHYVARAVWVGGRYVIKNVRVDGPKGGRIVQVRWKKKPVFRVDHKANPSPTKTHLHYGNMKKHRPWYAPWKKY